VLSQRASACDHALSGGILAGALCVVNLSAASGLLESQGAEVGCSCDEVTSERVKSEESDMQDLRDRAVKSTSRSPKRMRVAEPDDEDAIAYRVSRDSTGLAPDNNLTIFQSYKRHSTSSCGPQKRQKRTIATYSTSSASSHDLPTTAPLSLLAPTKNGN
jgi:hypothetical protein